MPLPNTAKHSLRWKIGPEKQEWIKNYKNATCVRIVQLELWIFQGSIQQLEELLKKGDYILHHVKYHDEETKMIEQDKEENLSCFRLELRRWYESTWPKLLILITKERNYIMLQWKKECIIKEELPCIDASLSRHII